MFLGRDNARNNLQHAEIAVQQASQRSSKHSCGKVRSESRENVVLDDIAIARAKVLFSSDVHIAR
jgi:hypothetical protein